MSAILRQLRIPKTITASETAKLTIGQAGLNAKQMARWAEINVIGLLNRKPGDATKKVAWIVEACQRVIQIHEQVKLSPDSRTSSLTPDKDALFREVEAILSELHVRLSKYRWACVVSYLASPDQCFDVQYLAVTNEKEASECRAVAWIMDHIHAVHRIRRCNRANCRKWFFAVTDHQRYCSDTCRKWDARQGQSFKDKRAEYMKKYRRQEAEREERAKQLAGRK